MFGHRRMKACNMIYIDVCTYDILYIYTDILCVCLRSVIEYLGLSVLGFMFDSMQHMSQCSYVSIGGHTHSRFESAFRQLSYECPRSMCCYFHKHGTKATVLNRFGFGTD